MHKAESGFTLIEILVAVAIMGIIFSFVYRVATTTIASSKEQKQKMTVEQSGRYFIGKIATDLSCYTVLPWSGTGGLVGRHYLKNGRARDEIHFTAFTRTYFTNRPAIDQAEIGYYFFTDRDGVDTLMRRESDIVESPVDQGGQAFEVSKMVDQLLIKYWDGNVWKDAWDTPTGGMVPKEISVELTLDDGKRKYLFTTIVRPVV